MPFASRLLVALAVSALAACGQDASPPQSRAPLATPDVRPTGPLTDLAACGPPPAGKDIEPVEGLVLPAEATITAVNRVDPSVNVLGYVPLTPSQTRRSYGEHDDVRVLSEEDETYDAEVLITTGSHRMFLKVVAVCAQGSQFSAVVAAEADAQGVPSVPGATAAATPP